MLKRHRLQIMSLLSANGVEGHLASAMTSDIADILCDKTEKENPEYKGFLIGDSVVVTHVNTAAVISYNGKREGFDEGDVARQGAVVAFDRKTMSSLNVQVDIDGRKVWGNTSCIKKV